MPKSEILQDKLILAVNEDKDVLEVIEEEFSFDAPGATLHGTTTCENALQYLISYTYDLALLDIAAVSGFDLLQIAHNTGIPVVVLTAHALSPEALRKSIELGARAYLPLEKLGSLIPFLEDVLKLNYQGGWRRALDQVGIVFNQRFGSHWRRTQEEFWAGFDDKMAADQAAIIK